MIECRVQVNKRIGHHRLLDDLSVPGNLQGLLEQGVQVAFNKEVTIQLKYPSVMLVLFGPGFGLKSRKIEQRYALVMVSRC